MAPPTKRARGGAGAAPTDKKYRRGSSSSWAGRGSGKRGGAASGRGGVKGQAIGGRGIQGGGAPRSAGTGRAPTKAARLERAGGAAAAATGRVDEEEEEWAGIQSSPEPEQEGQDSDEDDGEEDDEEPAARAPPPPPVKKQRKPTGGTGKKQKVFVEGKNDLLALAASVSGDVVKKAQEKVEKAKNKPVKAVEPKDRREPSDARKNQIAAARAVVAARTKAKKDGNRVAAAEPAAPSVADPSASKKGVRFA
ncbi:hypothetical protein JCM8115_005189 [Rhodotorula mucilaginosa]|uniref:Uncharacterized protein n=1 Tax=Rhodotorula mucilaginosa TaxID=5537 RepID=A0A9P6VZE8_RHOMI|nr:hypothetical protein C6P46_005145 [Rhodotorula mucilaginosa]